MQGKETTEISEDVYDSILLEIKKQKLTNMATLTRKKVKDILKKLQVPFLKHASPQCKSFLSYSYCLNKMVQLLEKDLDSFPLLKSREKLHQRDVIWQKICAEIGWDFIPSL